MPTLTMIVSYLRLIRTNTSAVFVAYHPSIRENMPICFCWHVLFSPLWSGVSNQPPFFFSILVCILTIAFGSYRRLLFLLRSPIRLLLQDSPFRGVLGHR